MATNSSTTVFHSGEVEVQRRAGVAERAEGLRSKMVRNFMPDEHRAFFAQLPFIVLGALDDDGRPWASIVSSEPGFVATPTDRSIRISALPAAGDPLREGLEPGRAVGLLGIEPHTRRRNRANGVVSGLGNGALDIDVAQSFGNCPAYIQSREPAAGVPSNGERNDAQPLRVEGIAHEARDVIAGADTFYIASRSRDQDAESGGGVDVSHRGGLPGFARIEGEGTIAFPDYAGNNMFNTLGNLASDPRCGLVFPDFAAGVLWSLTGTASVSWDAADAEAFVGAKRVVRFEADLTVRIEGAIPAGWSDPEYSPALKRMR